MRPTVWVTAPRRGGLGPWLFTWLCLRLAGARPIRVVPGGPLPDAPMDALVIGGGADVDPSLYGEQPAPPPHVAPHHRRYWGTRLLLSPFIYILRRLLSLKRSTSSGKDRDELETRLLHRAEDLRCPVLGICRGAQLLNVFHGGTLHRDLEAFYTETVQMRTILPRKSVTVDHTTLLYRLVSSRHLWVNALHKQAVDKLGEGVRVCAREDSGVIQGVEHTGRDFVLGVQWHPEFLYHLRAHRGIWRGLVRAAKKEG